MTKLRKYEILTELAEFAKDLISDLRASQGYMLASADKASIFMSIQQQIDVLRVLVNLTGEDLLLEAFRDFDADVCVDEVQPGNGRRMFSERLNLLLSSLEPALIAYQRRIARRDGLAPESLLLGIQQHRGRLLGVCKRGTRAWDIIKSSP